MTVKNGQSHRTLSRRGYLTLLSAGGIAAAGGYLLFEYAPWLDYDGQANQIRRNLEKSSTMRGQMKDLVRYATLAASGHNTQPWTFLIKPDAIEIHPDYTRRLAIVDPADRELWISLGCALENLLIGARAVGYAPDVTYPDAVDFIHVRLKADTPQSSPLCDAIPLRQNTRSEYNGSQIKNSDLDQVRALPLEPGVALHWVLNSGDLNTVSDYVCQGNLSQFTDKAFVNELISWIRFNKKEALTSLDGLYSGCVGSPSVPRWVGRLVVVGTKPWQQADGDARKLHSSSGAVIVASALEGKTAWVRAGQVYERLALTMTSLNIKSAFLNQPIEAAAVRGPFQSAMGLGADRPQMLVRFGYANSIPRSLRRPAEQVIVEYHGQ